MRHARTLILDAAAQPGNTADSAGPRRVDDTARRRGVLAGRWWPLLVITGVLVGLRRAEAPYADGDVLWGARAGKDFLASGVIARTDAYSWTAHGTTWVPNSWGWNVVLGIADKAGGLTGIALLGVAASIGVALAVGARARRAGATRAWATLSIQITAGVFALFMYPRAQMVDYVAVLLFPLLFESALRARGRALWLPGGALVLAQAVWMNLHATAVLGPVLLAAAGAGHLLGDADRRRIASRSAVLVALASVACLATPYGTAPISHVAEVRSASAGLISEWRPVGFASPEQWLGVVALVLGALAAAHAVRARRFDAALILVVLGVATATAIRFAPMLALFAAPELAAAASRLRARDAFMSRISALAITILAIACLAGRAGFAHPGVQNSSSLVTALPRGCRLLNDLGIGGDVILRRPDVPVSIDSRNDMYGRSREVAAIDQLANPATGIAFVRSSGVTCVLAPSDAPLVIALRSQPRWRVAGTDSARTLLLRDSSP